MFLLAVLALLSTTNHALFGGGGKPSGIRGVYDRCWKNGNNAHLVIEELAGACLANMGAYFNVDSNDRVLFDVPECKGHTDWMSNKHDKTCHKAMIPRLREELDTCVKGCRYRTSSHRDNCNDACVGVILSKYFRYFYDAKTCEDKAKKCYDECIPKCMKVYDKVIPCNGGCSGNLVTYLMPKESKNFGIKWKGPLNSNECGKYLKLGECIDFAKRGDDTVTWERSFNTARSNWPKGCTIWESQIHGNLVYYNKDSRGGRNAEVKPVCKLAPGESETQKKTFESMRDETNYCITQCTQKLSFDTWHIGVCKGSCMAYVMAKYPIHFYGQTLTNSESEVSSASEAEEAVARILERLLE